MNGLVFGNNAEDVRHFLGRCTGSWMLPGNIQEAENFAKEHPDIPHQGVLRLLFLPFSTAGQTHTYTHRCIIYADHNSVQNNQIVLDQGVSIYLNYSLQKTRKSIIE